MMALTLLVYSLGQRKLRAQLEHLGETVLNQKQKPTSTPTLRWVFQKFQAIHWVTIEAVQQVSNLSDEHSKIYSAHGTALLPLLSPKLIPGNLRNVGLIG